MKDDDGCQPLRSICANATEAVPLRMTERVSYRQIYAEHADRYDELVGHEDFEGELPRALKNTIAPAARVVDVGAGTGRVTRLLLEAGVSVVAVEPAAAMLERTRENLASWPSDRLALLAGDARELPLDDASVDAAVAGWAFGHFRSWFAPHWRPEVDRALSELERVVRPGGACVVIETLGTGTPTAGAPSPELGQRIDQSEDDLRKEKQRLDARLDELAEESEQTREDARDGIADALDDLEHAIEPSRQRDTTDHR